MTVDPFLYTYIAKEETYPDGSAIIEEGSRDNAVYVVLGGHAKVKKKTKNGVLTLGTFEVGAILGGTAFLERKEGNRSATVVATGGPVKVGLLDMELLERDYERLSPQIKKILKTLMARLKLTTEKVCEIASGSSPEPKEEKETKVISLKAEAEGRGLVRSLDSESKEKQKSASPSQNEIVKENNHSKDKPKRTGKTRRKTREKSIFQRKSKNFSLVSRVALSLAILAGLTAILMNHYGAVESEEVLASSKPIKRSDIKIQDKEKPFLRNTNKLTNPIPFQMVKLKVQKDISGSQDAHETEGTSSDVVQQNSAVIDRPLQGGKAITGRESTNVEIQSRLSGSVRSRETLGTSLSHFDEKVSLFPYSIYLGSYRTLEQTRKAISVYQKKGLSPYWVKVDLGNKDVWFRLFSGYFRKREQANEFIEKKHIDGAKSRHTRYGNLIGIFDSEKELDEKKLELSKLGYCSYVIPGKNGESLLYSGAFYQKARALEQQTELVSKGITCEVVER